MPNEERRTQFKSQTESIAPAPFSYRSRTADLGAGSLPRSVVSGQFNGDTNLDLVVANFGSSNVSVLLGNGDNTFQPAVNYAAGSGAINVVVGDLDGDSKQDLVVANNNTNTISVLKGNGDGTFQAAVNYTVGSNPRGLALIDLNSDNKLDLVTALGKLRPELAKERHVWRVCKINPDAHQRRRVMRRDITLISIL